MTKFGHEVVVIPSSCFESHPLIYSYLYSYLTPHVTSPEFTIIVSRTSDDNVVS